jgi:hypothetical protein
MGAEAVGTFGLQRFWQSPRALTEKNPVVSSRVPIEIEILLFNSQRHLCLAMGASPTIAAVEPVPFVTFLCRYAPEIPRDPEPAGEESYPFDVMVVRRILVLILCRRTCATSLS